MESDGEGDDDETFNDTTTLLQYSDGSLSQGQRVSSIEDIHDTYDNGTSLFASFQANLRLPEFRQKMYALSILTITTTFMFADQNLLAPNVSLCLGAHY